MVAIDSSSTQLESEAVESVVRITHQKWRQVIC